MFQTKSPVKKVDLDDSLESENNKELKRLQFYGAGPKMAGYNIEKKEEKTRGKVLNFDFDPVSVFFFVTPSLYRFYVHLWFI